MGFDYGDFDAHNALWTWPSARGTTSSPASPWCPARWRRGLDAPAVKRKLIGAGDRWAGEILDVILRDEIGHVVAGNRWYRHLCDERGLDPVATYAELAARYEAPRLRAPSTSKRGARPASARPSSTHSSTAAAEPLSQPAPAPPRVFRAGLPRTKTRQNHV